MRVAQRLGQSMLDKSAPGVRPASRSKDQKTSAEEARKKKAAEKSDSSEEMDKDVS